MQRRSFLKLAGLAGAALFAQLPFPWNAAAAAAKTVSYGGLLYRAGRRGKVLVSANGGSRWKLHSDLGDSYSITRIAVDRRKRLRLTVAFGRRTFGIMLAPDRKRWLTG